MTSDCCPVGWSSSTQTTRRTSSAVETPAASIQPICDTICHTIFHTITIESRQTELTARRIKLELSPLYSAKQQCNHIGLKLIMSKQDGAGPSGDDNSDFMIKARHLRE